MQEYEEADGKGVKPEETWGDVIGIPDYVHDRLKELGKGAVAVNVGEE